jgi:hypothetical protein
MIQAHRGVILEGTLSSQGEHRGLSLVTIHLHAHHHGVQLPAAYASRVLINEVRIVLASHSRVIFLSLHDHPSTPVALVESQEVLLLSIK